MRILNQQNYQISGFSLLELLVSIIITFVVSGVAIQYSKGLSDTMNKRTAEIQVQRDLRYSQALTVEQGCRGIFKVSANNKQYSFGCDYIPYDSSASPTWDTLKFTKSLPTDIKISQSAIIMFNSRGQSIDTAEALTTSTVTLSLRNTSFNVGTLRPTGLFEYAN